MLTFPQIDPVILHLWGPFALRWYGLMYLIGFAFFWWLGRRRAAKAGSGWKPDEVGDLLFIGAIGVVVGGRVGYVLLYDFARFLEDPLVVLQIAQGGMSFHGGLAGVLVAMGWFAWRTGRGFFQVSDFVAPLVPIGLGAGRLGNFIGGDLWGRPTELPWGMVFPHVDRLPRHPSQLYQAFLEGLVLFALLWWFSSKPRPTMAVSGLFLLLYGCFRFIVEFAREPDRHIGFLLGDWLTMGMLLSTPMMLAGAGLMAFAYRRASMEQTQ
jgi:phosphatidylglycerol:prolipoprotein diacylglycerol transferase